MRAKAGEARDRAVAGKRGDALSRPLHDAPETRGGRVRRSGIFHIHGGRAHEEIAVDGRRHENALAHFGGQLEHGAREHAADLFVQQHIFALARRDRDLFIGHHVVELGAVQSRGVDDDRGLKAPLRGLKLPEPALAGNALHAGIEEELHAVAHGVFRHGAGELKGADDAARGRIERGDGLRGDVRLKLVQLLALHDAKTVHAVFHAAEQKLLESRAVGLVKAQHERPAAAEQNLQPLAELRHRVASLHVEPCHERAGAGVKARVDNGGVSFGRAGAYILARFDHGGAQRVFAQLHRRGAADNAGAHDKDIVLHSLSLSLSPGARLARGGFFIGYPAAGRAARAQP